MKNMTRTLILLSIVLMSGCSETTQIEACENIDYTCFLAHASASMNDVKHEINRWSTITLTAQLFILFLGIVSTIVISIQRDNNKSTTRPVGIIATTLATGIATAMVSFHVSENVDKLISILSDMASTTNKYASSVDEILFSLNSENPKKALESNRIAQGKIFALSSTQASEMNKLRIEVIKIKGSAARFQLPAAKN